MIPSLMLYNSNFYSVYIRDGSEEQSWISTSQILSYKTRKFRASGYWRFVLC